MGSTSTKRTIVTMAYEEASLSGYEFDVTPEELATGLRRLDGLMAQWSTTLPLGYNAPAAFGGGDLDDPSGIDDADIDCAAMYLALRIYPAMGKTMTGESRYALSAALVAMRSRHSFIPNAFLPANTTRGAGHRIGRIWGPFIRNDRANTSPTLGTLSLASSLAVANMAYSSVILGTSVGSTLTLIDSRQKFYFLTSTPGATSGNGPASLIWTLNRTPYSVAGGIETPVVQESLPGAYGSPTSTRLSVNVSPYVFGGAQRAAYVVALAF